jgi:hypothetical protein
MRYLCHKWLIFFLPYMDFTCGSSFTL